MLKQRIITSIWGIALITAAIWFDKPLPWFTVLIVIWGTAAAFEFYKLARATQVPVLVPFGLVWTALFIISRDVRLLSMLGNSIKPELVTPLLLSLLVVAPLIYLLSRANKERAFAAWAWTAAGILYIGWLLGHFVGLRGLPDGRNWVFLALFTTFASDTFAFFIGRTWGRHHLAPRISPKKTWEGSVGGALGAAITGVLFTLPTPFQLPLTIWSAALLGIAVSVFGQLGDLAESLLKRNAGAKDSGTIFPGHGGALDRMDSVIFAGVVVYYFVVLTQVI